MKKLKLVMTLSLALGACCFTAFSQSGLDTAKNSYNKGVNQDPSLNNNQNINNPNKSSSFDNNKDITSPGQNSPSDLQLNKQDSVTLYKKGGTLINTDSTSQFPVNGPSDKSYGGTMKKP